MSKNEDIVNSRECDSSTQYNIQGSSLPTAANLSNTSSSYNSNRSLVLNSQNYQEENLNENEIATLIPYDPTKVWNRELLRDEVFYLMHLAWPIIVAYTLTTLQLVEDQIFLGHIGTTELKASALGNTYYNIGWYFLSGACTAGDTLISQAFGASDHKAIRYWTNMTLFCLLVLSIPIAILFIFSPYLIKHVFVETDDISQLAGQYCQLLIPGFLFGLMFLILQRALLAQQVLYPPLYVLIVTNLFNIAGNYFFIHYCGLGFIGSPLATSASRFLSCILLGLYYVYYFNDEREGGRNNSFTATKASKASVLEGTLSDNIKNKETSTITPTSSSSSSSSLPSVLSTAFGSRSKDDISYAYKPLLPSEDVNEVERKEDEERNNDTNGESLIIITTKEQQQQHHEDKEGKDLHPMQVQVHEQQRLLNSPSSEAPSSSSSNNPNFFDMFIKFMCLAIPGGFMTGLESWAFDTSVISASHLPNQPYTVDAHQAMLSISALTFLSFALPFSIVVTVRVGSLLGSQDPTSARRCAIVAIIVCTSGMAILSLILYLVRNNLGKIFTPEEEVIEIVANITYIVALFQLLDGFQAVAGGVLRGTGAQKSIAILNFVCFWCLGIPIGLALAFKTSTGVAGLWWGFTIALSCCTLIYFGLFMRIHWNKEARKALGATLQANLAV